jgi:hypothetical protein
MLHRKTLRNWASGNFEAIHSLSVRANISRQVLVDNSFITSLLKSDHSTPRKVFGYEIGLNQS